MTRRERLEARADKRDDWAASRITKRNTAFSAGDLREEKSGIPFGQPVLVGHHSERRHRRALERADAAISRGVEHHKMAEHHSSAAEGIRRQLDHSIFSDDENAIEALEAKAAKLDEKAEFANRLNASWRRCMKNNKGDIDRAAADVAALYKLSDRTRDELAADAKRFSCSAKRGPMSATHERAEARRCRLRIEEIKAQQARQAAVEAAGGILVKTSGEWCEVQFEEKPEREVITALKAAGFRWGSGRWFGKHDVLPECVRDMLPEGVGGG